MICPKRLDETLKAVIEDCVNAAGGPKYGFAYASVLCFGAYSRNGKNIVDYREETACLLAAIN